MGVRDAPTLDRASDLGLAFQLTNIARDVVDDAKADRVFVPKDLLLAAGAPTTSSELTRPENWPAAHKAACAQLDIAEAYLALAVGAMGPAMGRKSVGVTPRDGFYERPETRGGNF